MTSAMTSDAVVFGNVTLGYDRHPAVHHLDTSIPRGSLTAVVGPNGAGKSTLLRGVMGALAPIEGRIVCGVERDAIAYLPQQQDIDRAFPARVFDLVAMGLWAEIGPFGGVTRARAARVATAIAAVGLTGFEGRPIRTLSGGQFQRALFARLLLQDAELILLDEPFTAIDARTVADLIGVIRRWHGEERTVVAVLHDLEAVRAHFPQALLLSRELIAHGDTAKVLTAENLFRARQVAEAFEGHPSVCERGAA